MLTRLLLSAVVVLTLLGSAALTLTGCDDDNGLGDIDMTVEGDMAHPDLRQTGG